MAGRLSRFVRHRIAQGADRGGAVLRTNRAGRADRADRGATAIEFVFLTPVLFFMIFGAVQFAMYSFGETVAKAAAQAGARTARAEFTPNPDGWAEQAETKTFDYLDELGRGLFEGERHVRVNQTGEFTVRVEVEADVPSILGFIDLTVQASSEGPVERFDEDDGA
ncbi:TadE/TadG family type IV pilus assembly protein [Streptomyces sp. 4N509B]|uniref:TadE/TadG family type IV pilus assembly protein n=1 Tax=Streptomyces sp. 4N509B TaxID=3457413 RepID=UPI003FD25F9F